MNTEHLALLQQAPASTHDDDTWARLCCEQALLALEEGCYAVGALLVDGAGELLCSARNQVFTSTYSSAAHAEMQVLDQLRAKNGRGALYFAGQGVQQQWQMKREMLSPRYTTRYGDLLRVR